MAEPVDTAARLLNDNRTVVGGKDSAGTPLAVVPLVQTVADSALVSGKDPADSAAIKVVATPGTHPVFMHDADGVATVTIVVDKTKVRKVLFNGGTKLCYVNAAGMPLDANGAPTTVTAAIDAAATPLTVVGEAVTDYTQRPLPGTYPVSSLALGSSPYIGWTAQK